MTWDFWRVYLPAVGILLLLSGVLRRWHPIRWWRYRKIRLEKQRIATEQQFAEIHRLLDETQVSLNRTSAMLSERIRRAQLDSLATSSDRRERRIIH
jgi:hypothetical protein